jgi:hypothetical protein
MPGGRTVVAVMCCPVENDAEAQYEYASEGGVTRISGAALVDLLNAVLMRRLPFRLAAPGYSMSPFIRDHDTITIAPWQESLPAVGEIVAFTRPGSQSLVVHRIVHRRGATYLIQGDNNPGSPDGYLPRSSLFGRVVQVERNGRRVRLGLGPERLLIAFLSRRSWLVPLLHRLAGLKRRFLG